MDIQTIDRSQNRLIVKDSLHIARVVNRDTNAEFSLCECLRYDYFVRRKGWIVPDAVHTKTEIDCYDDYAKHLAVFHNLSYLSFTGVFQQPETTHDPVSNPILAYLRVLLWTASCGFMLDHEFRCLLSDEEYANLHRTNAVELSRLVIAPGACTKSAIHNGNGERPPHVVELLLKLLYHVSLEQRIEHYYIVVEKHWLPAFTRRFHIPFKVIGREYTFPDGTVTVAAHATRTELEQAVAAKDPQKYRWYQQREPVSP